MSAEAPTIAPPSSPWATWCEYSVLFGSEPLIEHKKTGMLMVLVPSGRFLAGEAKFPVELPAFYIGLHAVTNAQYGVFVKKSGHRAPDNAEFGKSVWKDGQYPKEKGEHPVVCVSWEDARAYCEWAGLRLASELEWEKAACGEGGRKYPWGEEWDEGKWCSSQSQGIPATASVWDYGSGASPWGALQMSGNAWEWCEDWHEAKAYDRYQSRDVKPPGSGQHRVVRGGTGHNGHSGRFTASDRHRHIPDLRFYNFGFRCVLGLDVSP